MNEWERSLAIVILNYNGYELTIESTNNFRKLSKKLNMIIVLKMIHLQSYKLLLQMTIKYILLKTVKIQVMLPVIM